MTPGSEMPEQETHLEHQTRQRAQTAHTSLGGPPLLYQPVSSVSRLIPYRPDACIDVTVAEPWLSQMNQ